MYTSSSNLNAKAKFQNVTLKMLALIPTYDTPTWLQAPDKRGHQSRRDGSPSTLHRSISLGLNKFSRVGGNSMFYVWTEIFIR